MLALCYLAAFYGEKKISRDLLADDKFHTPFYTF